MNDENKDLVDRVSLVIWGATFKTMELIFISIFCTLMEFSGLLECPIYGLRLSSGLLRHFPGLDGTTLRFSVSSQLFLVTLSLSSGIF